MLARVRSAAVNGIDAFPVEVEVYFSEGDTRIVIVGLPDTAVKESRDRVGAALRQSGFQVPFGHTTINLAPAHARKAGPSFDLPIAIGMLAANRQIHAPRLGDFLLVGELALTGAVRPVAGVLSVALRARQEKVRGILVPEENAAEAGVVKGVSVIPVGHLRDAASFLEGQLSILPRKVDVDPLLDVSSGEAPDFEDVKGQESVKRALEVAAAGGHNVLLIGPPGTGKSMLAKRLPSILPPLTLDEALETTRIHSSVGLLPPGSPLVVRRPFRSPHHTVSDAGLLGGNVHPTPGEISLAHHGVLFLDELPEFRRNVLETMRQPLEEGVVTISRAAGTMTFPCEFMLIAAMNPTPDGKMPQDSRSTPQQIQNYLGRVSGPLLDRIDMHIEVPAVPLEKMTAAPAGEASAAIRERVLAARLIQKRRFAHRPSVSCNARMTSADLKQFCSLSPEAARSLRDAMEDMNLSARAYDRILKAARTIADLESSEGIHDDHLCEALHFRSLDRQFWT